MKTNRAQLFIESQNAKRILDEVINYICASFNDPELWHIIQEVQQAERKSFFEQRKIERENGAQKNELDPGRFVPLELTEPQNFVSIHFFLQLSAKLVELRGGDDNGGSLHYVGEAFELLLNTNVLDILYGVFNRDAYRGNLPQPKNQPYWINKDFTKYLINNDLIYNHLFGFGYIIDRYHTSVVKIEVTQREDQGLGTGWLIDLPLRSPQGHPVRLVVTNDHVLEDATKIKVLDKFDRVIPHHRKKLLLAETKVDIALIMVDYDESIPAFTLHENVPLLEEVITMGYPAVPLAREAYQLVHRGEVNARVTDYFGQELLIISARTAPGNSGSPVIDDTGRVVGMITKELFEKTAFEQKGITPYSACIPASVIHNIILQTFHLWLPT